MKAAKKPAKKAAKKAVKKAVKRAVKKAAKKPVRKGAVKKAAKRPAKKAVKKVAKKPAKKAVAGVGERRVVGSSRAAAGHTRRPAASRRAPAAKSASLVGSRSTPLVRSRIVSPSLSFTDSGLQRAVESTERLVKRVEDLAREVNFSVALTTQSGDRLQDARGRLSERALDEFRPAVASLDHSEERLRGLGFTIVRRGRFALSVRGPLELVQEVTKAKFIVQSRPRLPVSSSTRLFADSSPEPTPSDLYLAPAESLTVSMKGRIAETIDDFVFIPPPLFFAPPAAAPPALGYHALTPDSIPALLNVPSGASAQGVRVAVIDSGFADHPYYQTRNFRVTTPGMNPREDANGHGTAITANLFAVAPDADVYVYRQSDPPQDALEEAFEAGNGILSCSWGWDHEQSFPILEATIRDLVAEGAIFLFAAGNGHHAWPSTMPEVISIGGIYADPQGALEASSYASGFLSSLYPDPPRRVPDVCGLCGQAPHGIYIAMPCAPGCDMDRRFGGSPFPTSDETKKNDGWVVASGTSSATPQVAGVVALLVARARAQGAPHDAATLRNHLEVSARAISRGRNVFGFPATGQPNTACGWGLVDAAGALARIP